MQPKKLIAVIIVLMVLVGLGLSAYFHLAQPKNQAVACTEEALQCPDGSFVGRTGAQWAFAACPNQPFFTGTLKQDANGFTLVTAAPDMNGQEVTYAIPLKIKISNVLGQIVGKKVKVFGSFTQGATL